MAGDWIKMRANLRRHPKVVRIASALNADRLRVVGGLHAVWCLFDEHSIDGQLSGYTPSAVDDEIGWPGFARALVGIGWLNSDGNDGLSLPEFDTHNGASAKRRAQEADRKRNERDAAKDDPQDGDKPSARNADKKRTREEKRREEKKEEGEVATRCPPDFDPKPEPEAERGIDRQSELANFRDHYAAKPGPDGESLDWQATWRKWARKAHRNPADIKTVTVPGKPGPDPALEKIKADAKLATAMPKAERERWAKLKGAHA